MHVIPVARGGKQFFSVHPGNASFFILKTKTDFTTKNIPAPG